jgi:voltage-gated potassium channel
VDCFYYSFATLTTLGPGDISPVTTVAKLLAILEAFSGQVYLAIFIAQLMGLNLGKKLREAK